MRSGGREAMGQQQREQAGNGACVYEAEEGDFVTSWIKGSAGGVTSFQLGNNTR